MASTMAPTAPMAPASVGVARPMKMVPSTRKISTIDGTIPQSTLEISGQPRSVRASGRQRRHLVRLEDRDRRG